MTDESRRRIPITDRRVSQRTSESSPGVEPSPTGVAAETPVADTETAPSVEEEGIEQQDFLQDLQRLQADFDNYRKRMMREQAASSTRAKARLMEQLLPVLDDFERALEHEESSGMELIYKQLRSTLEAEGLEEIAAEGKSFDPTVHEAVDSREEPGVDGIVVQSVFRRGYKVGDQILRAAMVVVARPPELQVEQDAGEPAED